MEVKQVTVYKYDELEEDIKKKVLINMCDINVNFDWYDSTYDDAKEIGLKITGFDIGRGNDITGDLILSMQDSIKAIKETHGDICDTYKLAVEYEEEISNTRSEDELEDLEERFEHDLLEEYLLMIRREYEYQTSDESIEETIRCNEYDFTDDGKIF